MTYKKVKEQIQKDLNQRDLKKPSIRLNALESVEKLIAKEINEMCNNPLRLLEKIDKNEFKQILAQHKNNGRLNDAESSIINEFYYRTNS